jgi:hypothetical protein
LLKSPKSGEEFARLAKATRRVLERSIVKKVINEFVWDVVWVRVRET